MKYCQACGHANSDESKFCQGCGAPIAAAPEAPAVAAPVAPMAPPAPAPVPVAPPVYAAPAAAPPAYAPPAAPQMAPVAAGYAAPAPPAYPPQQPYYGAPAPVAAQKTGSGMNKMVPIVAALVVVALAVAGYFVFMAPMSGADYKAKAVASMTDIKTMFASSPDITTDSGRAEFVTTIAKARASIATFKGLRPPAEYQSIHQRLVAGLAIIERYFAMFDAQMAAGTDSAALQAVQSQYTDLQNPSDAQQKVQDDFSAALKELDPSLGD